MATISIQATNARQVEGGTGTRSFTFTLRRTGDLSLGGEVGWQVSGIDGLGTLAANSTDFDGGLLPSGIVTFAADQSEQLLTIAVLGDSLPEYNERFQVALTSAPPSDTIETGTAAGTILSDEVSYSIGRIDGNQTEGSGSGSSDFTFMIYRDGASSGPKTVDWSVAGAALAGMQAAEAADFDGGALPSGTLTFSAGETKKLVTVKVAADNTAEMHEGFTVSLANPSGNSRIGRASADGSIRNDDGARYSIAADAANVLEGTGGPTDVTFTVTRTGTSKDSQVIDWNVTSGSRDGTVGMKGDDFVGSVTPLPSGNIVFLSGETRKTITVQVAGDAVDELNESFTVNISPGSGNAVIGNATATTAVIDDDGAIAVNGDNDTVEGTEGDDLFLIGTGNHQISGLGGVDTFALVADLFSDGKGSTTVLFDLDAAGGEKFDLSRIDAIIGTSEDDAFSFIGIAAFSNTAGELRTEDVGGGAQLITGDVNGDSLPDFAVFAPLPLADSSFFIP